jgi:Uncharacterized conserved protein
MRIDGRCHCGYLSFEAEADPEQVSICHCTDCQNGSGTRSAPASAHPARLSKC